MPKKKSTSIDEPSTSRPQRNMKAKIVFDPSDNYIPKKRSKKIYEKKKSPDSKSKPIPVNELPTIDISSSKINTVSPVPSRSTSPVEKPINLEISHEESDICCICSTNTPKREFVDCPICLIKTHKDCLLVNEPMWKFQLDTGSWLCAECRSNHCSKCLQDNSESELLCVCITCKFGLHMHCYEAFEIKPLHSLKSDMFICIPCMTLATQRVPEVEEDEDLISTHSASIVTSEDEDQDFKSVQSINSSSESLKNEKNPSATPDLRIPDVTTWNKFELYNYLIEQNVLKSIAKKILDHEIDGCALHLLQRNDIIMNMDLLVGNALALYKQVRILQTRSTFPAIYWE